MPPDIKTPNLTSSDNLEITTFDNLSFEDSFKLSILTLTNTVNSALFGLDYLSFFDLKNFIKMSLIIFMILGKIEIIAVIYLISKLIFKG